ncbi:sugar transporter [Xinfangfangia sp. CPCC 101601]|uniref:Sugar transporter n=1 Tax=Pseudogemmobacter lacusdianii TaxID=3069608 RepID=A0ABU0VZU4_9RHOB|nr:sugar transporter [Xinfangfangia sp. CPCC 101601]MDQ2067263.1 sugar transporter [Xinfangfangia sp. CPCC 101601]
MTTAGPSRLRARHIGLLISFLLFVALPLMASAWYLWVRAADQYASTLGFSVHQENGASAISLLSGFSSFSGSSSTDTDIIHSYINSQQLVTEIDAAIDLRRVWSRPAGDVIYRFDPSGTTEDLLDYWREMVNVYYDSTTRLIEVRVLAFDPVEAQQISTLIFEKSTLMINELNAIAVEDTLRYSRDELNRSHETVIKSRQAVTAFRDKYQIVDPESDLTLQAALIGELQQQLTQAVIDLDVLRDGALPSDPRLAPLERRVRVIEERLKSERAKFGLSSTTGGLYPDMMADYERLAADREFAEASYLAARAGYEVAQADAVRKSRYLAAHVLPTLAESSRYPDRPVTLAAIGVFLFMIWSIGALLYYSLRDRR